MGVIWRMLLICSYFHNSARSVSCVLLGWFVKWEVSGRAAASRISSKQHTATLCSFYQPFSQRISGKSKQFNHAIVLTRLQLRKISVLFYFIRLLYGRHRPIAIYALLLRMSTLLSLDEILLPRYMNWCTNFGGMPFKEEIAQFWLKHRNSVLSEFMERPMILAACFRLCRKDSAWTGESRDAPV